MLEIVRAKAIALRRRRRLTLIAGNAVIAAGLLAAAIAVQSASTDSGTTIAANDPGAVQNAPPAETPATTGPSTSTSSELTTTTTRPSKSTTTTGSPSQPALCSPEEVGLVVTTDRPSYAVGERVTINQEGTNRSGHDCRTPVYWEVRITNERGDTHVESTAGGSSGASRWRDGEQLHHESYWTQHFRRAEQPEPQSAPPGRYTVLVTWQAEDLDSGRQAHYRNSASFVITER